MSFDALETSTESSRPIELYKFEYQGGTFRYTTDHLDQTIDSAEWVAVAGLSRSAIEDTGEISKASVTLTAPEDFEISLLFEVWPPSDVVDLTIYRVQRDDLTDIVTQWIGRVLNASWAGAYSTLICESLQSRLKQPGLRRIYAKNCPHVLYGSDCRASQAGFQLSATLDALSDNGYTLHSPDFDVLADGYLSGGKIRFDAGGGNIERRGIREHVGDAIVITHPIEALLATSTIDMWPGCDRTKATCISKFDNLVNYGGFPYMPSKNPFGQSSVF